MKCGGKFRLFNHEDCQRWLCWCKAWACSAASRWGSDQNKSHVDMLSVHIYIYIFRLFSNISAQLEFCSCPKFASTGSWSPRARGNERRRIARVPKSTSKIRREISELNSTSVTCVHSHYCMASSCVFACPQAHFCQKRTPAAPQRKNLELSIVLQNLQSFSLAVHSKSGCTVSEVP